MKAKLNFGIAFAGSMFLRAHQEGEEDEKLTSALRRMEVALTPQSPTAHHRWMFENSRIEWRALNENEGKGALVMAGAKRAYRRAPPKRHR